MGRSPCCERAHTNKGAWTKEEDQRLIAYIRAYGEGSWRSLPTFAGLLRCGKSCRLRWINYLRPDLKRGNFTEEDDDLIIKLHGLFGNKWSLIASRLPGRTDNEIKNYWNSRIKRKLLGHGIDPQTHCRINSATHPPVLVNSTANRVAITGITKVNDRSHSESSSSASCSIDLNLQLSLISLRHSSVDDPPLGISVNASTMKRKMTTTPAICLCYSLGFRGSEECGCQAAQEQEGVIRYCSSMEMEQRDYFS